MELEKMLGLVKKHQAVFAYFCHIPKMLAAQEKKILSKLIRAFLIGVQPGLSLEYDVYNRSRHTQEMKI